MKLGVNIDHVATLRQARREFDPDPLEAARICLAAGVDSIVAHLREDRRHMNDRDIHQLRQLIKTRFNLEMSLNPDIVKIATRIKPDQATLVPEKRQEITTEGGLDVIKHFNRIRKSTDILQSKGIDVSLFIDPVKQQIDKAKLTGARMIELHTGTYALSKTTASKNKELNKIKKMSAYGTEIGLIVHAGHGLKYHDTKPITQIKTLHELNIGHSIISHAVFVGLDRAVKQMLSLIKGTSLKSKK